MRALGKNISGNPVEREVRMVDTASSSAAREPAQALPGCLAEQLDEVQLLEAMAGREGEFEWRQAPEGRVTGRLQVFLGLDGELEVCVAKRERCAH